MGAPNGAIANQLLLPWFKNQTPVESVEMTGLGRGEVEHRQLHMTSLKVAVLHGLA